MVFVLSAPTGFAIAGMALFYASMLATTLVEGHIVVRSLLKEPDLAHCADAQAKCVVIGAGVWLFFLGCYVRSCNHRHGHKLTRQRQVRILGLAHRGQGRLDIMID